MTAITMVSDGVAINGSNNSGTISGSMSAMKVMIYNATLGLQLLRKLVNAETEYNQQSVN